MIRLVVFDLWKTLASRERGYSTRRVVEEFGIDMLFDTVVKIFENSVQTKRWRSKYRAYENFCRNVGIGTDSKTVNRVIEIRDCSEASTRPLPHTMKMLKRLREGGYKTGLLSNSSVFAAEVLERKTKILDYIDYPVFSFEVGAVKPDLKIFRKILEISGFRPEETVMIGDKTEDDVEPAKRVGMKAILYTDYEQLKRDLKGLGVTIS
jgi:HAD superfamily hydrolase (TIGR01509 family)